MKMESKSVIRDKLNCLLLIKLNKVREIQEISERINRHRNVVSKWLEKYRQGGLETFLQIKQRTEFRPAVIRGENLVKLQDRLSDPKGFDSYYEIQKWLKDECNLDVKYANVHNTVRYRLKAKPKVARPSNINKNKDNEIAFKKNF